MVVYRASPADVRSGVRVGDIQYPGYRRPRARASARARIRHVEDRVLRPAPRSADLQRPHRRLRAPRRGRRRSDKATFVDNVFEKPFKQEAGSDIDDKFIDRVVPDIIEHSPELKMEAPPRTAPRCWPAFLRLNGELRRINADEIARARRRKRPRPEAMGSGSVRAARQPRERSKSQLRRPPHLRLQGQGSRSADAPRLRSGGDPARPGRRRQRRHGRQRELARHLRQLRDHRPRPRRAVALRPPDVVRRQGRRQGSPAASCSARATQPASPAAITSTSPCSSAATW